MTYQFEEVSKAADDLKQQFDQTKDKRVVLKSTVFGELFKKIKELPPDQKGKFGAEVNNLKKEVENWVEQSSGSEAELDSIDITAPFDTNIQPTQRPKLLQASQGTIHPLMKELEYILDIFYRMGFESVESRELDDDFHMFESLNFPEGHPARDDYDTFTTIEGFIAPAHTSTMQNRVLKERKDGLDKGKAIAVVIPGRTFRNEDLDARHEHTFYQLEGVYVDKGINVGHLVSTIRAWLSEYYAREIITKIQPFYFPFTEPSFEFAAGCIFCEQKGCNVCSHTGWIELGGCGMINPNVLKTAEIDPIKYTGFAWGFGIERLVMIKYGIEDVRYFESGRLDFLEQFK